MRDNIKIAELENEKKNKRRGLISTVVFHTILLLIFIFFGLTSAFPPPLEGILINFGTSETGQSQELPTTKEEVQEVSPAEAAPTPPVETIEEVKEEVVTQEVEEAPVIEKKEEKKEVVPEKVKEKPKEPVKKPEPVKEVPKKPLEEKKEPVKEEPKADPRAMFSGSKSDENKQADQGITGQKGDQGVITGDPSSDNYKGTQSFGLGNSGVGYDLTGRSMLSIPPIRDESQETGKVAVRIKVDRNGNIIEAIYTTKGSTSTNAHLIALAEKAARDAKFNTSSNAPEEQWGTIIFTFKLK